MFRIMKFRISVLTAYLMVSYKVLRNQIQGGPWLVRIQLVWLLVLCGLQTSLDNAIP